MTTKKLPNEQTDTVKVNLFEKMNQILFSLKDETDILSPGEKAKLRRAVLQIIRNENTLETQRARLSTWFETCVRFDLPLQIYAKNEQQVAGLTISEKWALWIYCAIQLKNNNEVGIGKALAKNAPYSQVRLIRLLTAKDRIFINEMIAAIHYLKSQELSADIKEIGYLIFNTGDKAETIRLEIARDYYKNINSKNKESNE